MAADDNVGRVLDLLDELRLAENTVVVFAGDNGYYLGEHRLGDKRSAYEESMRIPLLLRYPKLGARGKLLDELVLNIDLAPIFLDLAGIAVPRGMQGRSWRPLLAFLASTKFQIPSTKLQTSPKPEIGMSKTADLWRFLGFRSFVPQPEHQAAACPECDFQAPRVTI
jgi:hypothetical protein